MLDATDPRLVSRAENLAGFLLPYRLAVSPDQTFTLRYVPVLTANTLSYILAFLVGFLAFVYAARFLAPRSLTCSEIAKKFAWACLILFPSALLFEIAFVEVASYNIFLWTNFATLFAAGIWAMILAFWDVFIYDRPVSGRLAKFLWRKGKKGLGEANITPSYIQVCMDRIPFLSNFH